MNNITCNIFLRNPEINPLTGRKIKKNGPVYKKLMLQCSPEKRCLDVEQSYQQISHDNYFFDKFLDNPEINPFTGRKIKKNGHVYKKLMVKFSDNFSQLKIMYNLWKNNKNINPFDGKRINYQENIYKIILKKCKQFEEIYTESTIVKKSVNFKKELLSFNDDLVQIPHQINNWILGEKLGKGSYGTVYECYSLKDQIKGKFAIKIEHVKQNLLPVEAQVYFKLYNKSKYTPIIYDFGTANDINFLVMENLENYYFKFTDIPELLRILKFLAEENINHGDVNFFSNIMTRKNGDIVFIDFGLSQYIKVEKGTRRFRNGSLLYMSIFTQEGIITYRNDLESLLYNICDELTDLNLPWCDEDEPEVIQDIKITTFKKLNYKNKDTIKLFNFDKKDNQKIYQMYMIIGKLKKTEYPNYDLLISLFS